MICFPSATLAARYKPPETASTAKVQGHPLCRTATNARQTFRAADPDAVARDAGLVNFLIKILARRIQTRLRLHCNVFAFAGAKEKLDSRGVGIKLPP
jgi:hypothetical protein